MLRAKSLVSSFLLFIFLFSTAVMAAPGKPSKSAIASAHPLATQAGEQILKQGGNAFDAAIAVSAALAVVEPASSGLGGGGFWLLHRAEDGKQIVVDGREVAPMAASHDMFLNADGEPIPDLSREGALAAGIPGHPAALAHIAEHYGQLSLQQSLAPAISLAKHGFRAGERLTEGVTIKQNLLRRFRSSRSVFLPQGEPPTFGALIVQPDLAKTLQVLAERGHDGFYEGRVARRLVQSVRNNGGIWTLEDLKHYRIVEREPLIGDFFGLRIIGAPPPSSGAMVMINT
ncbi:MAG: gamma-glutamyltransferase, partial [Gammaproteobacteria bacterium]|nr:gamma-glutamyltransferase [Gammaproteobacteria bacterium]